MGATISAPETLYAHSVAPPMPATPSLSVPATLHGLDVIRSQTGQHAGIELRLLDMDGNVERYINTFETTAWQDALNDVGAGSLTISAADPLFDTVEGAELIAAGSEVPKVISVLVDGTERGRWMVEEIVEELTATDLAVYSFSGRGIGAQLEWGAILPTTFNPPTNVIADTVDFTSTAALTAWKSLFDAADARGATGLITLNFTDGADSDSTSWPDSQESLERTF